MKVLYVNHTGALGGAEHSLLTLIEGLPDDVRPIVASPAGPLHTRLAALGVRTELLPGTTASFRLDALGTSRAVWDIARSAAAVRALAHRARVDLIHANSVRAGLIVVAGSALGRRPAIVHVRDVLPGGPAGALVRRTLRLGARQLVCISEHVARSFGPRHRDVTVIPNGVDLVRWDPAAFDRAAGRARLGLTSEDRALGVVAQITPWKGQDDAIAALRTVRRRHPRTRLLLIGEAKFVARGTRFDNRAFHALLVDQARTLGLDEAVSFLGERADVPALVHALDVLLVPSWEEPFGRSVIEGMAMERAVLATSTGGPREIIADGTTGLLAAPRDVASWAEQIARLLDDDELRVRLGRSARASMPGRFDALTHVRRIVELYRTLSARPREGHGLSAGAGEH
ncbi:MAG TPA: glycosyltransferase family 4 protein [Solirubrobacteraceae bacterium]|nr:glycosyltransferase family 4 protein [Solirubrobacteraceae bacterium]